jgi:hypothetical protein
MTMNGGNHNLDRWLNTLGAAKADGVLSGRPAAMPWKNETAETPVIVGRATRRAAGGLAVAAAVGLVLVGMWQLESMTPSVSPDAVPGPAVASNDGSDVTAPVATDASPIVEGDYNGDGVVDGEDIQNFQYFLNNNPGAPEAKSLARDDLVNVLLRGS